MMRKIKTTLIATLVAMTLSSCIRSYNCLINNPIPPVTGADAALFVRVVDNPQTRSSAPIPPGTPLVLNEGNIYLVDADGVIVHHFTIVSADGAITMLTPEKLEARTIPRNLLDDGVLLPGVLNSVTEVVIIGNTPKETHTGNVDGSLIGGRLLNVLSQYNAQDLNLFGREDLPPTPDSEGVYRVTVHLAPTVARMELPSITGFGSIIDFTVDGVFINHYHQTATVSGTIPNLNSAPNLRSHTDVAAFAYNAPGTSFTTASNNALFYWNATANNGQGFEVDGLTVRPSNQRSNVWHPSIGGGGAFAERDHVWGFQVFAKNYGEDTPPVTEAPQLVIRLSNITFHYYGQIVTITEPRFITIGSLYRRDQQGNIVPIEHVRAGNVYHIRGGIVFDREDLGEIPGENEKNVEVIVTLAVWDGGYVYHFRQPNPPSTYRINAGGGTLYLGAAHPAAGITYQWQQRENDWVNVEGATGQHLILPPTASSGYTYFRRAATLHGRTIYSTAVQVYRYWVPVDDIVLDGIVGGGILSLLVDGTKPLAFTISPNNASNQTVTWSSSDTSVATISAEGVVTAVGVGEAIITITTVCGKYAYVKIIVSDDVGNYFSIGDVDFTMIEVEGGVFQRGLSPTASVTPIRWVRVDDFRIAQTQVTRALYRAVMAYAHPEHGLTAVAIGAFTDPAGQNNSNLAANHISWYDAVVFMNRLSVLSGLTPVFELNGNAANLLNPTIPTASNTAWNNITMDASANGFRFPTESQWEYAARGGQMNEFTRTEGASGTNFNWSGSSTAAAVAWHNANSGSQVRAVATLAPNELGIYDMSGNVQEWCWDRYATYPSGTEVLVNPTGPATGSNRVRRGGSWSNSAAGSRVAVRHNSSPWDRGNVFGLRVALP